MMHMHRLAGLAVGFISGISIAAYIKTPSTSFLVLQGLCFAFGGLFFIAALRADKHWNPWPKALVFGFALLLALPMGYTRTIHFQAARISSDLRTTLDAISPEDTITLKGKVISEPEWRDKSRVDMELNVSALRKSNETNESFIPISAGKVLVRASVYRSTDAAKIQHLYQLASPLRYGDIIEVEAKYSPINPTLNPHEFDYEQYLQSIGIEASLRCSASKIKIIASQLENPVTALALWTKSHFINTFKTCIRSPASRLASAATLGTRRSLEGLSYRGMDIITMFRHAGVGHVLAVSGLHVSVVTILIFMIFRATRCPTRIFTPPLILFLILFAILTGARPSSVRAVIMNSTALIMIAYFRCNIKAATIIGLSLSASAILLHNPSLIFAPSFLLSYGAVLSLLLLVGPIQTFLLTLRGASVVSFIIWFSTMIAVAGWNYMILTSPLKLISLLVLLIVLIRVGNSLNDRMPALWSKGFVSLPAWIRLFFSAQLAIQIGMMIPLSAWFFGRFPVAGVFVNLAAIPIVGILVQLGMLVGLVGLIPWIGTMIAMPLGAATTLIGELFLFIAYLGAKVFPFPVTPKPSTTQLFLYYAILCIALLLYHQKNSIYHWVYRYKFKHVYHGKISILASMMLAILAGMLWLYSPPAPTAETVHVLATRKYPVLLIHGNQTVDLINLGDSYTSERIVLDQMLALGVTRIRNAYLPSPSPDSGLEGAAALAVRIPFDVILLPVVPNKDETFTEAIGDAYLRKAVRDEKDWARRYDQAYADLQEVRLHKPALQYKTIAAHNPSGEWQNVQIAALPVFSQVAPRFHSSAISPILHFSINQCAWVMITDTTLEALRYALRQNIKCNVLVISDLHTRSSYFPWLEFAVENLAPNVVIVAGDKPIDWPDNVHSWMSEKQDAGMHWIETAKDGAVKATFGKNGSSTLNTYKSKKEIPISCTPLLEQKRD